MSGAEFIVREMKKEDIPQALDVWKETGLQEGTHCIYTWFEYDNKAFYVAVNNSGEIIGTCSAVLHLNGVAFVGMYAVREKYRGSGIGYKIWKACMEHIGTANAALNAIPEKTDLYRNRGGFPILETGWTCLVNETTHTEASIDVNNLSDSVPQGITIEPFNDRHLPLLFSYDRELVGYDRTVPLELNCKEKDSHTLVAMQDGKCVGFGTVKRSCQVARQVGPLYADDAQVAETILKRLLLLMPNVKDFAMMTISSNQPANDFIKRLGCPTAEECPRLYKTKKLNVDFKKVFAQWDLNFSPW